MLPTLAVMVAVPAFFAVTLPLLLTVATDFLLEVHVTAFLLFFNVNVFDCPTVNVNLDELIFTVAALATVVLLTPHLSLCIF